MRRPNPRLDLDLGGTNVWTGRLRAHPFECYCRLAPLENNVHGIVGSLRPGRRRRPSLTPLGLGRLLFMTLALALMPRPAAAVGSQMFTTIAASTGEKPQSKIWYHDGSYWAILHGPSGVAFYEKVGSTWQLKTFANAVLAASGNADVKWNGTNLFVLNYASPPRLFKYSYATATRAWVLVAGFPITLPNPTDSETMVLEQDSTGRLWMTAEGGGNINVYYSTSADHRTWTTSPVVLQTGVNADDICSIVAFGGNKVGVFWSDQNRWEFGFRVHQDANSPTTWSATEVVVSGTGISDDHINLAFDTAGQVYAITKDASNLMRVHRRSTSGIWTTKTNVFGAIGTRGIIMVAEADAKVYILCTRWDVTPFRIDYRVADINTLTFGASVNFISTTTDLNNVTDMKQLLPAGSLVAIAENMTHCWYNSFGSPPAGQPQPPGPPANLAATLVGMPAHVDLAWSAPATGAPDGYNVYRQTSGGSFTKLNAALVAGTSYTDPSPPQAPLCYQVTAVQTLLEGSASASACVDNSPLPPPNPPQAVTVTLADVPEVPAALQFDFDAGSGQTASDTSGNGNHAQLGSATGTDTNDPAWVAGVTGTALQFDGSSDYIQVADSPSLDMPGSFTVEAWVRQNDGASTGTLVNKGDSGERTYRIRITSGRDVEFRWETTTASTREVIASQAIPDAGWHHVACVYDQAQGENRVYVDGLLQASAAATGTPASNNKALHIGARFTTSFSNFLDGAVDGFRIAPSVLYTGTVSKPGLPAPRSKTGLLPEIAAQRAQVAWQPPSGGSAVASYNVYRAANGGTFTRLNPTPVATTSFTDGVLTTGSYCYRVTAINVQGLEGSPSASDCVEVLPPVPAAPQALTAQLVAVPGAPLPGAAAYTFDAGSGQTFADVLGNGHTGQLGLSASPDPFDPQWVAGLFGTCLRFAPNGSRASVSDAADLRFATSFTLEAWINRDVSSATRCVIAKGIEGELNYALVVDASGVLRLRWHEAGGIEHGATSASAVPSGDWHHVAGVHDAVADESRVYIDGALAGSTSNGAGVPATSTAPLLLGALQTAGGYTQHFGGAIDLVRVAPAALYSGAFSPPQSFDPPSSHRVDLAWTATPGTLVAGYNVYRQVDGASPVLLNGAPVVNALFTDATPPAGALCYSVATVDTLGRESAATAPQCVQSQPTDTEIAPALSTFGLDALPNPFNPATTLSFYLPAAAHVRLVVYDARGRRVATLLDAERGRGPHNVRWHGQTDRGVAAPSGAYFAILQAGHARAQRRLVLLK